MSMPSHFVALRLARFLLLAATALSAWLGWQSILQGPGQMHGCPVGSACGSVLHSPWAWVGPVPTAWAGAAYYFAQWLLLGSVTWRSRPRWLISLLSGNLAAALFFTGLQVIVIGAWCPWCCAIHLLAAVGAAASMAALGGLSTDRLAGFVRPVRLSSSIAWSTMVHLLFLGSFSSLLLTAKSEEKAAPPTATTAPVARSVQEGGAWLSLHGGTFRFDLKALPLMGSAEASHLVVCVTDPTCHHCRNTSQVLNEAWRAQKQSDVALVFLPGTRDPDESTAIQTTLLTLWRENPKSWADISTRLHTLELAATVAAVTEAARLALGGKAKLNAALQKHRAWAEELIRQTSELMTENARLTGRPVALPQTLYRDQVFIGALRPTQDSLLAKVFPAHVLAKVLDPGDPCEARFRAGCGRLIVPVVAAGELPKKNPHPESDPRHKTFDPQEWDSLEYDSFLATKQFSPHSESELMVQVVAITSDEALAKNIGSFINGPKTHYLGHAKTSLKHKNSPSIEQRFNEAIKNFENDTFCRKLMNRHGMTSVLPLLKVEYIIDSEFAHMDVAKPGLPAWSDDSKAGSINDWLNDGQLAFYSSDWSKLTRPLVGSVEQSFVNSCNAAALAKAFERDTASGACICFVAATDSEQSELSGGPHAIC